MSDAYDVLIKGGSVYDGISENPRTADVGIVKDKITGIGTLTESASKTIDARGLA